MTFWGVWTVGQGRVLYIVQRVVTMYFTLFTSALIVLVLVDFI